MTLEVSYIVTVTKKSIKDNEWDILSSYLKGIPYSDIASETDIREITIKKFITEFHKDLSSILETETLISAQNADTPNASKVQRYNSQKKLTKLSSKISTKFLELLSEPTDPHLSQEEQMFSYLMVYEGDSLKALQESGLDIGVGKRAKAYMPTCRLRITYLKGKSNLASYIKELQIERSDQMDFSKATLQSEIMNQLDILKSQDNPKNVPTIAKLTEQLGRLHGMFTDNHKVESGTLDDAFQEMLDRREVIDTNQDSQRTYVTVPEEGEEGDI